MRWQPAVSDSSQGSESFEESSSEESKQSKEDSKEIFQKLGDENKAELTIKESKEKGDDKNRKEQTVIPN